jgi:hypothetical protein
MARFVLLGAGRRAICVAESPSEHDAFLYGVRNVHGFSVTLGVEAEEAYFARTHDGLVRSFKDRYVSEGRDEATAQTMADVAAGPRPFLQVVYVPKQAPMPRSAEVRRARRAPGPVQALKRSGARVVS